MTAVVRSRTPGLRWPGLPGSTESRVLALQFQYAQTERWPAADIEAWQFRQIEALIAHCERSIPFWRDRLRKAGLRAGQRLTPQLWSRLPILTRNEVQDAGEDLRPEQLPDGHGQVFEASTSGSTGIPLRLVRSELDWVYWDSINLRQTLWQGVDLSAKCAIVRNVRVSPQPVPEPERHPDWGAAFAAFTTGQYILVDIRLPVGQIVDCLVREQPALLSTFPSTAGLIARHCREHGIRIPGLKSIIVYGEVLTEETRLACRDALGIEVADAYSAEEAGFMAVQCPLHPHLHVMSEYARVEILDEQGVACAPGQVGRVVVTPLHNFANPLLRYHVGDYAEVGSPCDCGRTLPVLSRILGRARDRVRLPDGTERTPFFGAPQLYKVPAVVQNQLAQVGKDTMEYRLVVRRPLTEDEEASLVQAVQRGLGYPFNVRFRYIDAIARSPSGKYMDFVNELDGSPD